MRPVSIPAYIAKCWEPNLSEEAMLQSIRQSYQQLTQNKEPEVSVVIPAYNEEKNILQTLLALSSNITQWPVEIVVVNNNSKDRTELLVTASGVRCVNETKQGITAARNAGLKAAKGKYILNADADSIYPKDWIELMIYPLAFKKDIALTYGRFSFIPIGKTGRWSYFFYEYFADVSRFIKKYIKDEAVNVYGFNSAYRRLQGLAVEGYNHPPGSNEDGYLALKLRNNGYGKLYYVTNVKALVWTSDRRIQIDGGFMKASVQRIKKFFFLNKEVTIRSDL